jgi:hypothetical protein
MKRFLTQKDKQLEVKWHEQIWVTCSKKKVLIDQGTQKIEKQLEISNIITKLFEIEKLKHFLLDEN